MAKRPPTTRTAGTTRCAIYTRKSTEDGLEQEFNSLDAQREACAAYVASQKHEGWTLLPDYYDDGGFSGGSMDRPGLKQLLADITDGKVDVIVVYKVDRLTRSLADFAKIVDVLDGAGASFVSVTQAFNTTTSMGRLTLNVLLSFAQFEREVTGERIRDKIAASKRKGMWMGGVVPLGYDIINRKLIVNEPEAEIVRLIFERYTALGSVGELAVELADRGIRSKQRTLANGHGYGGRVFSKGALAHLLKNRIYIGEICHKGESFPGEHSGIIERDLFDRVQAMIARSRNAKRLQSRAEHPSPLAGIISDAEGRRMTPSHATKGTRRYRYYVTAPETPDGKLPPNGWRIPAGEIEGLVRDRLGEWLSDGAMLLGALASHVEQSQLHDAVAAAKELVSRCATPSEFRKLLLGVGAQVAIARDVVSISLSTPRLVNLLGRTPRCDAPEAERCLVDVPASLVRRGQELRLAYPPKDHAAPARSDVKLVGLLGKAEQAYRMLAAGDEIDPAQKPNLTRHARLKFLAPDIVAAILDGRQPAQLSARHLFRAATLPVSWAEQREMLGFS